MIFDPTLYGGKRMNMARSRPPQTVTHAGSHEQPIEAVDLLFRLASAARAGKRCNDLCPIFDGQRLRIVGIPPALNHDELPTMRRERAQIRIHGIDLRSEHSIDLDDAFVKIKGFP